ncbi:MAG: CsbD family protein [Pseudomonadota bacterium]
MDKDRINGAADQAKGAIKETAGKVTGDTKLKVEGAIDKATGKVESAMGKARDDIRDEASKP